MAKPRRRPTYYTVFSLRDGTVTAARPVRKPTPKVIKRDRLHIDDDNVCVEYSSSGQEFSKIPIEERIRFLDIFANNLNVRRALRTIILPRLDNLESKVSAIQNQLDRIEQAILALSPRPEPSEPEVNPSPE